MRSLRTAAVSLLLALLTVAATSWPAGRLPERAEEIRRAIEAGRQEGALRLSPDLVQAVASLARFYEARGFEPAWTGPDAPLPRARTMVAILQQAESHGLQPSDYHLERIERVLEACAAADRADDASLPAERSGRLTTLDLLLTDAALLHASHLASGKTDPTSLHAQWRTDRRELDAPAFLARALEAGDLRHAFADLEPPYPGYRRMIAVLARLRRVAAAGGWPAVPSGPALHPGEADERMPALRARLSASGDLDETANADEPSNPLVNPLLYDPALEAAVRAFQARHGLGADGMVGTRTAAALSVPVERRIEQLLVNLERWRWLPADLGERHLRVNIAGFELQAIDHGRVDLTLRVIVGKQFTKTPVFTGRLTYLVLNPYWWVPRSIAAGEILPKVQTDPGYLATGGYEVLDGTGPTARTLDPASIDWGALSRETLPYVFRQRPGAGNSLGRIKFMFPNSYNVYLHDTPEKRLFERDVRAFSHGCIRVERAADLATYLLRDDPAWDADRLERVIASGAQETVLLARPLPVHILYWTAWIDPSGALELRDDLYGRDPPVLAALRSPPPAH